jgi:uncharacterized protein (TIGR00369 family)
MTQIAERQRRLIELFHGAPIQKATGMTFRYNEEGQAVFEMPYNPSFDHAMGAIHGSIFGMLIDNAGWFTVAPHYEHWIVTVEFSTRLHEPIAKTALIATGRIVRMGSRMASAEMEVRTADNRLAATGAGTFIVTSAPYEK